MSEDGHGRNDQTDSAAGRRIKRYGRPGAESPGRISPEVAERIWKIAEELDYHPGQKRRVSEESKTQEIRIGVITQMAESSFMIQIHQGIRDIERELKERGVALACGILFR